MGMNLIAGEDRQLIFGVPLARTRGYFLAPFGWEIFIATSWGEFHSYKMLKENHSCL